MKAQPEKGTQKYISTLILPYIKGTTAIIGRNITSGQHSTRTKKINVFLQNPKDRIHLEGQGVYQIPCKNCDRSYIGHSGRNIRQRVREHELAVAKQEDNTSPTKHAKETGHTFDFKITKINY